MWKASKGAGKLAKWQAACRARAKECDVHGGADSPGLQAGLRIARNTGTALSRWLRAGPGSGCDSPGTPWSQVLGTGTRRDGHKSIV